MANKMEKMASIDAQLRQLAPAKVSEDDKLIEYDALLLDRFLDILQDLHGEDLKETVSFVFLKLFLDLFVCSQFVLVTQLCLNYVIYDWSGERKHGTLLLLTDFGYWVRCIDLESFKETKLFICLTCSRKMTFA